MNLHKLLLIYCLAFTPIVHAYDILTAIEAYEAGDYATAHTQFAYLAQNNVSEAQYNLAFMYFGGEGVTPDDTKAAYWFERAAKAGHASAQDTLGYIYLNGRGRAVNHIQAYAWYALAATNGVFLAKNVTENLMRKMDSAERIQAKLLSREYLEKYK